MEPNRDTEQVFPKKIARMAMTASITGYAIDGFDLLILGFMLPVISADLALSTAKAGSLVTTTLVGAVLGGLTFGVLSDRFGRVKVLTWTIVVFAVGTGLCGLSRGYEDLMFWRFIAGLGLGGEFGIGMTLVAEVWPLQHRARATSYVALGWQAGALAAALVTPLLLPLVGWRGVFMLGMVPGAISYLIRRLVDEPQTFLHKKTPISTWRRVHELVRDTRARRSSLALLILCSVQNFGYYGLMIWLPSYLSRTIGLSVIQTTAWTAATIFGMCVGIVLFGYIADHLGRRPALIAYQIGAAVMLIVYPQLHSHTALLFGGAVMGFFANGMLGG